LQRNDVPGGDNQGRGARYLSLPDRRTAKSEGTIRNHPVLNDGDRLAGGEVCADGKNDLHRSCGRCGVFAAGHCDPSDESCRINVRHRQLATSGSRTESSREEALTSVWGEIVKGSGRPSRAIWSGGPHHHRVDSGRSGGPCLSSHSYGSHLACLTCLAARARPTRQALRAGLTCGPRGPVIRPGRSGPSLGTLWSWGSGAPSHPACPRLSGAATWSRDTSCPRQPRLSRSPHEQANDPSVSGDAGVSGAANDTCHSLWPSGTSQPCVSCGARHTHCRIGSCLAGKSNRSRLASETRVSHTPGDPGLSDGAGEPCRADGAGDACGPEASGQTLGARDAVDAGISRGTGEAGGPCRPICRCRTPGACDSNGTQGPSLTSDTCDTFRARGALNPGIARGARNSCGANCPRDTTRSEGPGGASEAGWPGSTTQSSGSRHTRRSGRGSNKPRLTREPNRTRDAWDTGGPSRAVCPTVIGSCLLAKTSRITHHSVSPRDSI